MLSTSLPVETRQYLFAEGRNDTTYNPDKDWNCTKTGWDVAVAGNFGPLGGTLSLMKLIVKDYD